MAKPITLQAVTITPNARAVWLHVRDEGGWWRTTELAEALWPDLSPKRGIAAAHQACQLLLRGGHLARREDMAARVAYGVTHACLPPAGYTLEPQA